MEYALRRSLETDLKGLKMGKNTYKRAAELYRNYAVTLQDQDTQIVSEIGDQIVESAKELCPVDTGALQKSIHKEMDVQPGKIVMEIIADAANPVSGECYGDFVEYGTGRKRATGDGRQTPWSYKDRHGNIRWTVGQKPQPFMRPAVEKHLPDLVKRLQALELSGSTLPWRN